MSFNIEIEGGTSVRLPTAGKYCDRDIVVTATGGGEIQSASGTYTLASDSAYTMEIDVSNIGFIPDLAVVYLDDTELEYPNQITKMWVVEFQPELLDFVGLAEPTNKDFTTTNVAIAFRGVKETYTAAAATTTANFIGKLTTSDKTIIKVGRMSSTYPMVAGPYKWFAYKIWG